MEEKREKRYRNERKKQPGQDIKRQDIKRKEQPKNSVKKERGKEKPAADSLCPVLKKCGGCQFLNVPYETQLKQKQRQVSELLKDFCRVYPIVGMEEPFHYRNKVHAVFGYIFMGIGMGTREAMIAVCFHICAHAITKPVLFLSGGALIDASNGKRDFHSLHGAAHRNPVAGFAFLCGSLSMIGFPIFTGFISKLYFALSAFAFPHKSMLVLLAPAVSTILNVIYFMYVSVILYSGKADPARRVGFRQQRTFTVAVFVLVLVNVAIGLHSQPLTSLFEAGLDLFLG